MRILYYNWVDYLDDEGRGGGVSLYQRNLMQELGDEVAFLSSGLSFDLISRHPRWEQIRHGPKADRARRFEIVNSGVLAPGHHSFGTREQVAHGPTTDVFADFLTRTGPYDIVHFQNLEGLPAQALAVARAHGAGVVLSLHNYYPICPQVNLWWQERATCTDFDEGAACVNCIKATHPQNHIRLANGLAWHLKRAGARPGSFAFEFLFRNAMRLGRRMPRGRKARAGESALAQLSFSDRRKRMVGLINENCSTVLCVSDAVRDIASRHGITPTLLQTDYIGTRQSDLFDKVRPRPLTPGHLRLAYLGYMRRDKGFYFLLAALEAMPDALLSQLSLVLAARKGDDATMARVRALGGRLRNLHYVDGYGHDDLDSLLDYVDVGVVPVLWHDNLPQVAIEMHARRIPLLTSDMGGAQELGQCAVMVFPAGDIGAFAGCVGALLEGRIDLQAYWEQARAPTKMSEHVLGLMRIYNALLSNRSETKGQSNQGTEIAAS